MEDGTSGKLENDDILAACGGELSPNGIPCR